DLKTNPLVDPADFDEVFAEIEKVYEAVIAYDAQIQVKMGKLAAEFRDTEELLELARLAQERLLGPADIDRDPAGTGDLEQTLNNAKMASKTARTEAGQPYTVVDLYQHNLVRILNRMKNLEKGMDTRIRNLRDHGGVYMPTIGNMKPAYLIPR